MIVYKCDQCNATTSDFGRITLSKPGLMNLNVAASGPIMLHFCDWPCVKKYAKERSDRG